MTARRRARTGRKGQGLVEFSLILPVFLFVIFALLDGGFLLYSVNNVDQAATLGADAIAAEGNTPTADIDAVTKMARSDLATTGLLKVSSIYVEELVSNATNTGFSTNSDGTPQIQTGCTNGPNGGQCIDIYTFTGSGSSVAVQVSITNSPCASTSMCPPWDPAARNVNNCESSFAALVVNYQYSFFTAIHPQFNLTSLKTFRLEPELPSSSGNQASNAPTC